MLVPILCYHKISEKYIDVNTIKTQNFIKHVRIIKDMGYKTVFLDDVISGDLPVKPVCITFDDCYESFYTDVYPILKRHKIKATNFIATDYIGDSERHSNTEWESDTKEKKVKHCIWSEIQSMKDVVHFESHGKSHGLLIAMGIDELKSEIVGSKKIIEDRLNTRVNFFSYPHSKSNEIILNMLKDSGYKGAVTMGNKKYDGHDNYDINRIMMNMHTNIALEL